MGLEESLNEVFKKIGRNVVLFQRLEKLLKFLIANGSISGSASEFMSIREKNINRTQTQTMGQLVGKYLETHANQLQESSDEQETTHEASISFQFRVECSTNYFEKKKADLAQLVLERNELVHHLLSKLDINSHESCIQIGDELDRQKEKIMLEIDELNENMAALRKAITVIVDFLSSDEGRRELELGLLQQSTLILMLADVATQIARIDGWSSITRASQIIKQQAPDEITLLRERYGHKNLKALIIASEIFDVYEEPTEQGIRLLYRIKCGSELPRPN